MQRDNSVVFRGLDSLCLSLGANLALPNAVVALGAAPNGRPTESEKEREREREQASARERERRRTRERERESERERKRERETEGEKKKKKPRWVAGGLTDERKGSMWFRASLAPASHYGNVMHLTSFSLTLFFSLTSFSSWHRLSLTTGVPTHCLARARGHLGGLRRIRICPYPPPHPRFPWHQSGDGAWPIFDLGFLVGFASACKGACVERGKNRLKEGRNQ